MASVTDIDPHLRLPREIAPNIVWIGVCVHSELRGQVVHGYSNCYLVLGPQRTLLVDTGGTREWEEVSAALDRFLGDRPLDFLFPTHPEVPHSGNMARLLAKYPALQIIGDVRDYHLFYPTTEGHLRQRDVGFELALGGECRFRIVEPVIYDLHNTQWGYEISQRVLFTADGLCFLHRPALDGEAETEAAGPLHLPGECGLITNELAAPVELEHAAVFTDAALYWTRYVDDADERFAKLATLLAANPTALVAPTHGNVVADVDATAAIVRDAHRGAVRH